MSTNTSTRVTVATVAAKLDAHIAEQGALNARLMAFLDDNAPAVTVAAVVAQPKADGKVYRSAKGKAQAKVAVDKVWADAKAAAKVTRVKDLTPAQRAAVDAEVKAIWAAVPKTRTTKA